MYDFGFLRHCEKPVLFIHGSEDEHGDATKLEKLAGSVRNAESVTVTGADHFFTRQLEAVEETIRGWAEEMIEG
jgi:alpha/beta superfamily hydrolase